MSAAKLLRRSILSMNLSRTAALQQQMAMGKSYRLISSLTFNHTQNKDRQLMNPSKSVLAKRVMSTEAKFEVINIQDEEDFKQKVMCASEKKPVIVDFHATWCGPCKILAPRLESIISKKGDEVTLAKVDIDLNGEIAMEYGVRSVPTVVGIKNGKRISQFIGVIDDDQIKQFVEKMIIS